MIIVGLNVFVEILFANGVMINVQRVVLKFVAIVALFVLVAIIVFVKIAIAMVNIAKTV